MNKVGQGKHKMTNLFSDTSKNSQDETAFITVCKVAFEIRDRGLSFSANEGRIFACSLLRFVSLRWKIQTLKWPYLPLFAEVYETSTDAWLAKSGSECG